ARQAAELVHVARRTFGGEQLVQLLESPDHAVELGAQRGLHLVFFRACVGACSSLLVRPCESASSTAAGSSPRASAFSARSSSTRRKPSACSRSWRISGTLSRT